MAGVSVGTCLCGEAVGGGGRSVTVATDPAPRQHGEGWWTLILNTHLLFPAWSRG